MQKYSCKTCSKEWEGCVMCNKEIPQVLVDMRKRVCSQDCLERYCLEILGLPARQYDAYAYCSMACKPDKKRKKTEEAKPNAE